MRCGRCGYAVPEWLWIGDDHPIIIQEQPIQITRSDNIEDNTMKVVAESKVAIRMCKDVNPIGKVEQAARTVSVKCGLSIATCVDLLEKGWVYKEEGNYPSVWLSPVAALRE